MTADENDATDGRGGLDRSSVHHVSFATPQYSRAARFLKRSARRFGFAPPRIYGPETPIVRDLSAGYPEIMAAKRGAGYWLWKPFIIRDALARASDGDIVLYTDIAMVFVADPIDFLAVAKRHPVVLFESKQTMRMWTKRDCFVALDADEPAFWDAPQLTAGIQLYRASPEALAFIEAVCAAMTVPHALTDDANVLGGANLPEFRDHRHDQSILTIVALRSGVPLFPNPSQYGPRAPRPEMPAAEDGIRRPAAPYGQVFDHHRHPNRKILRWYRRRLLKDFGLLRGD